MEPNCFSHPLSFFLFSLTPLTKNEWKMPWKHCWVNKKEPNQCSASWSIGEVTTIESKPARCVSYLDTGFRKTLGNQQFGKFSDASSRYFLLCTLVSIHISLFRLRRVRERKSGRNERITTRMKISLIFAMFTGTKNGKTLAVEMKMFFRDYLWPECTQNVRLFEDTMPV